MRRRCSTSFRRSHSFLFSALRLLLLGIDISVRSRLGCSALHSWHTHFTTRSRQRRSMQVCSAYSLLHFGITFARAALVLASPFCALLLLVRVAGARPKKRCRRTLVSSFTIVLIVTRDLN